MVLSEHGRRVLQQLGLTNVVHIPPGIDVVRWAALRSQKAQWKARLALADHPVLLFPGHYTPGYGADVMLHALPRIVAQVPDVRVIFACRLRSPGDRRRERAIRQAVARLGLTSVVRFYNTVADMRSLIGASDLTVLPLETMRDSAQRMQANGFLGLMWAFESELYANPNPNNYATIADYEAVIAAYNCTLTGDVDNDGDVDVSDIQAVAGRWNTTAPPDDPHDLDKDGDIDVVDVMIVATNLGDRCGAPAMNFTSSASGTSPTHQSGQE